MTHLERRFRRIARSLSNADLMRGSMDAHFDARELLSPEAFQGTRFLDFYGDEGIRLALERYGLLSPAEELGYHDISIETSASDERHTLFVYGIAGEQQRERLVELVARRDRLVPREDLPGLPADRVWEVLTIEWLTMRHPCGSFSSERPRLPGQDCPGLGLGENVLELLYRVVERLHLDGLLAAAAHFHLAFLYSHEMRFFDPWHGGQLLALERDLMLGHGLTLAQASWAVEWGMVRTEAADEPLRWQGQAQIWPSAGELTAWFDSSAYRDACVEAAMKQKYELDAEAFAAKWREEEPSLTGASAA